MAEQNYSNHTKWVPTFHFFVVPVMVLNVVQSVIRLARHWFYWDALVGVLVAVALLIFIFNARLFALRVQDRVIRMEERQRMAKLLPNDLQARIVEFTPGQLVALRFASDGELPELARKVLTDGIKNGKAIKQMVKNWRADYLRA
ncbi:MAG TPA: DUF6526 family protein [Dongiaceae bacterium]|nr:DUF6526 family protein [Dongiaceae bacterium]